MMNPIKEHARNICILINIFVAGYLIIGDKTWQVKTLPFYYIVIATLAIEIFIVYQYLEQVSDLERQTNPNPVVIHQESHPPEIEPEPTPQQVKPQPRTQGPFGSNLPSSINSLPPEPTQTKPINPTQKTKEDYTTKMESYKTKWRP